LHIKPAPAGGGLIDSASKAMLNAEDKNLRNTRDPRRWTSMLRLAFKTGSVNVVQSLFRSKVRPTLNAIDADKIGHAGSIPVLGHSRNLSIGRGAKTALGDRRCFSWRTLRSQLWQ
jgi:hypothetical protein